VQLSRAFAEFAKIDPARVVRTMEQFEPQQQERAAGYTLDAVADDPDKDEQVLDALLDLNGRGFAADEYRGSAARAVEKILPHAGGGLEEAQTLLASGVDQILQRLDPLAQPS
jgi:hypothetical protein